MTAWPPLEQGSPLLVSESATFVQNIPTHALQVKSKVPTLDHPRFPWRI